MNQKINVGGSMVGQEMENILQQAITYHQAGQLQEAESLYRAILQVQPSHPDANHNLGVLTLQLKQPDGALVFFKAALEVNPDQGQYWISYIDTLVLVDRYDDARQMLEQGYQRGLRGEPVDALKQRLESPLPAEDDMLVDLFNQGRHAEIEPLARTLTTRFPRHGFGWKVLGAALIMQGRFAEALDPMQRATELLFEDAEARSNLGVVLRSLGQMASAEACYRQALKIKPDYAEVHNRLAVVLMEQGRFSDAEVSYRQAMEIRPDFAEAYVNLGLLHQKQDRLLEAENSFNRALELNVNLAEAHSNLGANLQMQGRFSEAEASCRHSLKINANQAEAHSNLGVVLRETGRLSESESSCRCALDIAPDFADAHCNLGSTLHDLGRLGEAELCFKAALKIKPGFGMAYCNLGHVSTDLGNIAQAILAYKNAMAADPDRFGLEAAVWLAVQYYLKGDSPQLRSALHFSKPLSGTTDSKRKSPRVYRDYIERLFSYHQQKLERNVNSIAGNTLYVIGESHSLSAHCIVVPYRGHDMRCAAQWIPGCKQWHLGNNKANKYKYRFNSIVEGLPPKSSILLLIGEIDCRPNEGVLRAWEKSAGTQSIEDVIQATIGNYLEYVSKACISHSHRLIISGVPAPNYVQLAPIPAEVVQRFIHVVRTFNTVLKNMTGIAGLDFLDVYSLTDRGDGIASTPWHIDSHHLFPAAITEAFKRHCIVGGAQTKMH
jgi:tetratricopeptide (TPR) repeat protein